MSGASEVSGPSAAPKAKPAKAKKAAATKKAIVYDLGTKAGKLAFLQDYKPLLIEQFAKKYQKYEQRENYPKFAALVKAEIEKTDKLIKTLQTGDGKDVYVSSPVPPKGFAQFQLSAFAGSAKLLTPNETLQEVSENLGLL